jgi:hypothetical protein
LGTAVIELVEVLMKSLIWSSAGLYRLMSDSCCIERQRTLWDTRRLTPAMLTSIRSTSMSSSLLSCWSSSLSSSAASVSVPARLHVIAAVPPAKHTCGCRNSALLVLAIDLAILAVLRVLVGVTVDGRLALALVGGRGLLLVVLRHVDYEW